MSRQNHKNVQKINRVLTENEIQFTIQQFDDSTRTAADAANCIGCEVSQIAKSLIFKQKGNNQAVLIIASGMNRVDLQNFAKQYQVELTNADANWVKKVTGFPIGGVPPVAHEQPLLTFLDKDLLQFDLIWAAAGTPKSVFSVSPTDLVKITQAKVIKLSI